MARFKMAAWTFGVVGALAAATVSDRGAFVIGFFWLMFGGIAGLLVLLARRADVVVESPKVDVRYGGIKRLRHSAPLPEF